MLEEVKTIISKNHISILILAGEDYTSCILPRYDTAILSESIKKAIKSNKSVNFKTKFMNVNVMALEDVILIESTNMTSEKSYQIGCIDGGVLANKLQHSVDKANKEFGPDPEDFFSKWTILQTF